MSFCGFAWLLARLHERLLGVFRRQAAPAEDHRCRAKLLEWFMFVCDVGHPSNNYTRTGLPRTHAGWEMQLLVDDGLLFYVVDRCCAALRHSSDERQLHDAIEQLAAPLRAPDWTELRARLRAHYAANISAFIRERRAFHWPGRELLETYCECIVLDSYIDLAVCAPGATLTFDLFPAHTGPDNVSEGLKGLVNVGDISHRSARKFYSCRAEIYTRYYGRNLARALAPDDAPRLGLVIPHANGVRHIALTRCWPIDGAENIARHVERVRETWASRCAAIGSREHPPVILVSGYSQGGAAVRLFDDAQAGIDVLARPHFRASAPRWYGPRARGLARMIAGAWTADDALTLHTVSIATMGGVDGQVGSLARDQRGAAGIRSHTNTHGGLHLAICHDHDPARWIVPGPLLIDVAASLRRRPRKLGIVEILRKFGGPGLALHGGCWTSGAHQAFAGNPAAMRLIEEVDRLRMSASFVDESEYFDPRCSADAFTHLVVGTFGYPGWTVVETFAAALARRGQLPDPAMRTPLLQAKSWNCDILPDDVDYARMRDGAPSQTERRHLVRAAE